MPEYLGPINEQAEAMREEEMFGEKLSPSGFPSLNESFRNMLRRYHREKKDLMRDLVRVETRVAAIERILGD